MRLRTALTVFHFFATCFRRTLTAFLMFQDSIRCLFSSCLRTALTGVFSSSSLTFAACILTYHNQYRHISTTPWDLFLTPGNSTIEILFIVEADNICQMLLLSDPVVIVIPISFARFLVIFPACRVARTFMQTFMCMRWIAKKTKQKTPTKKHTSGTGSTRNGYWHTWNTLRAETITW